MTRKVLETLRRSLRDHYVPREWRADADDALAWLDAFEKHAPKLREALCQAINDATHHNEHETAAQYQAALDWLEDSTTDEDT